MSRLSLWFHRSGWRALVLGVPYLWVAALFLVPCGIIVGMSLALSATAAPPFEFLPDWPWLVWDNYNYILSESIYLRAYLVSAATAGLATLVWLAVGYPMALAIVRSDRRWRTLLLLVVILPFWISFLLRVYAWMGLMGTNSWLNVALTGAVNALTGAELPHMQMMNTNFAVILVMVDSYLPFMVLPLYAALERQDPALAEAATDLGARPLQVFRDVTLPLSLPGMMAGALLTFIPASGELIIPTLVGDPSNPMIWAHHQ